MAKRPLFTRFRDAITGRFVDYTEADRRPNETVEESIDASAAKRERDHALARSLEEHKILRDAIVAARQHEHDPAIAYDILKIAIRKVLDRSIRP